MLTGEDWQTLFVQSAKVDQVFAVPFYVCFIVLVNWALTEMLIAVIVEKFEISEEQRSRLQQEVVLIQSSSDAASVDNETALRIAEHMVEDENDERRGGTMKTLDVFAGEQCDAYYRNNSIANSVPCFILKRWVAQSGFKKHECAAYFYSLVLAHRLTVSDLSQHVQRSLYIFTRDSRIRQLCRSIARRNEFEAVVFIAILASCAFLALDTPNERCKLQHVDDILEIADVSLLGVFTLEFLIKVIANGFSGKPLAYLSSSMNQ